MTRETSTHELSASNVQPIKAANETLGRSRQLASRSVKAVTSSYRFMWHAWLGTAVTSQETATKFVVDMAKRGEDAEEKARARLNETYKEAKSASERMKHDAAARVDKLEARVGKTMGRSLRFMGVPSRTDMDRLTLLMADMSESIEELTALKDQQPNKTTRRPSTPS